jgi:hypothetical protein
MDDIITTAVGPYNVRATSETAASSDSVDATVEQVWGVLPGVYEELGIPLGGIDARDKRLGNTQFQPRRIGGSRLSRFLDCGSGVAISSYADTYGVTMSLITRVKESDDGRAVVQTQLHAVAEPKAVMGDPVFCTSNGTLESRIAELVAEKVNLNQPLGQTVSHRSTRGPCEVEKAWTPTSLRSMGTP